MVRIMHFVAKINRYQLVAVITTLVTLPCMAIAQNALPKLWTYAPATSIESMCVSRNGQWIAVGGFSGVQIYHQSTHQLAVSIPDDMPGIVTSMAFSPDGSQLAIAHFEGLPLGGYTGSVELRSVSTGKVIKELPTTATFSVDSVAFSPDGKTLADGTRSYDSSTHTSNCSLELWSLNSNYKRATLSTSAAQAKSISFSMSGAMLAIGGYGFSGAGLLELWNLKTSKLMETFPTSATQGVGSVAISPDGKAVVDGGYTGSAINSGVVEEWTVGTGKLVTAPPTAATQVNSVSISPDGKTFAVGGAGTTKGVVEIWNLATGGPVASVTSNLSVVNAVSFSSDGKMLFDGGSNAALEIRNSKTLDLAFSVSTALYSVAGSVAFSADSRTLAEASYELGGCVNLWNAQTGQFEATLSSTANRLRSVAISPDNKTLADCGSVIASTVGVIELWDFTAHKFLASLPTSATALQSVRFSQDGRFIADGGSVSNNGWVELWNVKAKTLVRTFPTQATSVRTVAFSPDGSILAVGGTAENISTTLTYSGVVELWNASTGKLLASFATSVNQVSELSFSPDGKLLAVAGTSEVTAGGPYTAGVEVWNTAKGPLADAPVVTAGSHFAYSIVFSSSGKAFFVGTDIDMEAFSTSKFAKLATYNEGGASAIAVSSRGNLMAISSVIQWLAVSAIPY